jgi:peptidyl-Lys metalloendopeptidase
MRRVTWLVLLLLVAASGSLSAAGLRAQLDVDRDWIGRGDDVVANVTITNNSARTMVVPAWLVPGARLDANLFDVTRDGEPVRYLGILAKRPAPQRGDFVALQPGESLAGTTELTRHYEMTAGGEYVVAYRMDLLDGVQADELRIGETELESNAVAVWREDAEARPAIAWHSAPVLSEFSLAFTNCSSSQQSGVTSAVNAATNYSTQSKNYLNSKTWNTVGPRYTTWFGAMDSGRFNTVKSHFVAIEDAFLNKPVVVDCGCNDPYYAYVYPAQHYKIYVCNAFWSANNTGTDSRAGTLVHEMSHFNVVAGTDDWAYGQTACKKLAKRAQKAIDNADSHEYFAENTPSQN